MYKYVLAAAMLAAAVSFGAYADDDDHIMGNYQGAFSKGLAGKTIRAEVMGMSKSATCSGRSTDCRTPGIGGLA